MTIHDNGTAEGNSGTHGLTFTVTMNKASTKAVTVHFTTVSSSAVAGQDFVAKSGTLVGLERRLNIEQTLKVDRSAAGFTANVLQNPLATRARTISGRIDSSLFEAVGSAGGHDQTALSLADIFGYDIDFVLDIRPGDGFTVTYSEVLQDGKYLQDGPVLAARFVNQGKGTTDALLVVDDGKPVAVLTRTDLLNYLSA